MKNITEIPNIKFKKDKSFGFELISLKELKTKLTPKNHDPYKPHRLNFYVIFYITGGSGKHFIDFQNYDFCKGTILFISKGQIHAFDPSTDYEGELMLFKETFLTSNLSDTELSTFNSLFNYHIYSPANNFSSDQFAVFKNIIVLLKEELSMQDDAFKPHILRNLLKQLLLQTERYRIESGMISHSPYYNEFINLQKLLKNHIQEERSVKFYAQKLGISTKKMNLITQSIANASSKVYITSLHILEAKRLLISSFDSIDEISYKLGFEEPTNFVKYFKKYCGKTPTAFRKSNQ